MRGQAQGLPLPEFKGDGREEGMAGRGRGEVERQWAVAAVQVAGAPFAGGRFYAMKRGRYCKASARWGVSIFSSPARSAMVRASLRTR